jgi:thymidylate synthase (FAD)
MRFIEQSWSWVQRPKNVLERIERAGRVCYKSEEKISPDSAEKFVKMLVKRGHHSVLEHVSASVHLTTNRGVSHEIVRHRLASYSQESTRYVDYSDDILFILPVWWSNSTSEEKDAFTTACANAEQSYKMLRRRGWRPEQAREVLPNALKTELTMTANLREWRHFFALRTSPQAHPQLRTLAVDMLEGFRCAVGIIFEEV